MKRLFRARVLVAALIVLLLFAPPRCYPFPRTRIVSDQTPDELYIHIRSDRQQETAHRIREKLIHDGYLVPRIIMVSFGPDENQVRYFHGDRAHAEWIADELRTIGFTPITVKRIGHYESNPPGRYELWLAPHAR